LAEYHTLLNQNSSWNMRRTLRKTLLIVCEGKNTEPIYFGILKDKAIEEGVWGNIVIVPEPPKLDVADTENEKPKTRTFKQTDTTVERPLDTIDTTERKYLPKEKTVFQRL
jgi:hypothetical protein